MKALEGLVVLDLTHALAGPFCTYHLGLLGADVVKIEKPKIGDDFRDFARQPGWEVSPSFIAVNGGKRSISVNLKSSEGQEIVRKLAARADVVVENQRPGAVAELGLGWDDLKKFNPKLIYCSLSGFGQDGEMSRWPAYDHTIQAMSGMAWTGEDDDTPAQGRGFSIDCFSGYVAFSSILAALVRRERSGEGQFLDVAMLDSSMLLMGVGLVRQMLTGDKIKATQPIIHDRPTVGPFKTTDGWLWLSGNFQNHYVSLCEVLEAPELITDPRFIDMKARVAHTPELRAELSRRIAPHRAADLERKLAERGSPAARVRTSKEALAVQSLSDRQMLQHTTTHDGKPVTVMNAAFTADKDGPALGGPVPGLGEHTAQVLGELGYSQDAIARLQEEGAI